MMQKYRSGKRMMQVACFLTGAFLVAGGAGCQTHAKIAWDAPKPVSAEKKVRLTVGELAELKLRREAWDGGRKKGQIGRHTWTLFALPGPSIYPHEETPLKPSFDQAVRDALGAAGYELVSASQASPNEPVLRGEVNACWWWSYNWFWPLAISGGQNKLTLFLEGRNGEVLWTRQFSRIAPGASVGGAYGFGLMIKSSMTKLVRDIVQACSSEEFRAALRGT